jgi:hypothetical protein
MTPDEVFAIVRRTLDGMGEQDFSCFCSSSVRDPHRYVVVMGKIGCNLLIEFKFDSDDYVVVRVLKSEGLGPGRTGRITRSLIRNLRETE